MLNGVQSKMNKGKVKEFSKPETLSQKGNYKKLDDIRSKKIWFSNTSKSKK
jgi:hypothetical protein